MCQQCTGYQIALIALIIIIIFYCNKEKLIDFTDILALYPYKVPPLEPGKVGPDEYVGHGYMDPRTGMRSALGNTVRLLGQEFTQPNQGVTDTMRSSSRNYAQIKR